MDMSKVSFLETYAGGLERYSDPKKIVWAPKNARAQPTGQLSAKDMTFRHVLDFEGP